MALRRHCWPLFAVVLLGACAHHATPKLGSYDLNKGYRFERSPKNSAGTPPKKILTIRRRARVFRGGTARSAFARRS